MTTRNEQITLTRGDSLVITHDVTFATGSVVDISGSTTYFTVSTTKDRTTDTNVALQKTGSLTDPVNGECTFSLTPSDSDLSEGVYYFDIQISFSASDVRTSMDGTFTIIEDVTKT